MRRLDDWQDKKNKCKKGKGHIRRRGKRQRRQTGKVGQTKKKEQDGEGKRCKKAYKKIHG